MLPMSEDNILDEIVGDVKSTKSTDAGRELGRRLNENMCIGDLLSINYQDAQVLVHDSLLQKVQGLPHGSFLVASRLKPGAEEGMPAEDIETCLVLLRVIGDCPLPNARETEGFRFEAGKRAADSEDTWDHPKRVDRWTRNNLSFGGYRCRVLGTFRMKVNSRGQYNFVFGADLASYYSGQGMKVYKPVGNLLSSIVNYQKTFGSNEFGEFGRLRIGRARFAASEVTVDEKAENVPVEIDPADFVSRRTFYGGMSRGGKSNAMKITARAVYLLRKESSDARIGQLIFDLNGEYANDNVQDGASIKSVFEQVSAQRKDEIATYGLNSHPNDPERKIVKINFYGNKIGNWSDADKVRQTLDQLIVGKTIIDNQLVGDDRAYIKLFRDTIIEVPSSLESYGDQVRFQRIVEVYRSTLHAAGFECPSDSPYIKNLFSKEIRDAMRNNNSEGEAKNQISSAAATLDMPRPSWDDFVEACKGLQVFIEDKNSGYSEFDRTYRKDHDGRAWADDALKSLLAIYRYPNGVSSFRNLARQHSPNTAHDYAEDIVEDLRKGKLVIFDQSTGDPDQNINAAERILWAIFNRQKRDFIDPEEDDDGKLKSPPPIMVYLEEAHNLLPATGGKDELKTIWARMAKEGSKYRIGMVLATQEPSSVMPAILKNTDNWFIAHLNNSDEVRTIAKFYDFEDYAHQVKSIADPGFVRMRTLSNPFTIPVQVDLFSLNGSS